MDTFKDKQSLRPPIRHGLYLGTHCDDIEIGCGGTVLRLAKSPTPGVHTIMPTRMDDPVVRGSRGRCRRCSRHSPDGHLAPHFGLDFGQELPECVLG
jgi:hypothetical protein